MHPNRKAYNWLVYRHIDKSLSEHSGLIRGSAFDLGCGELPYRQWLMKYCDTYIGIDWSSTFHILKANVVADLNEPLPIKDGIADTVFSMDVIEHLRNPAHCLRESHRILKQGGSLLLRVPWQWWVHEAPFDYFRYTPYGLRHLLEQSGFIEIKIEPQGGFFTMMALKLNYFSLRLIRGPKIARWILSCILGIGWYLGQKIAPHLDRLDRDWSLETIGYFVTARKP